MSRISSGADEDLCVFQSFKLNVDSHSALKESVMEEGRALLTVITSSQSGLKDILHMVSSQWDQLQRQIRRQHGWMLRALRCIQARLFYSSQSREPFAASCDVLANRQAPCPPDSLKVRKQRCFLFFCSAPNLSVILSICSLFVFYFG
ncbi:A-kinase anchor protein 6-like [Anarrhichthys ocellatus]|uniref:A-kinase anchor protein 6-like n=1 Tax=Anarrhichthys ocellatus TaxID=433405 RepID=UPI0012EE38A0|nr:A-kinase anchor protein 6-like [Anarrhichthys ocellatus]